MEIFMEQTTKLDGHKNWYLDLIQIQTILYKDNLSLGRAANKINQGHTRPTQAHSAERRSKGFDHRGIRSHRTSGTSRDKRWVGQ